jgi:hypothetical protein
MLWIWRTLWKDVHHDYRGSSLALVCLPTMDDAGSAKSAEPLAARISAGNQRTTAKPVSEIIGDPRCSEITGALRACRERRLHDGRIAVDAEVRRHRMVCRLPQHARIHRSALCAGLGVRGRCGSGRGSSTRQRAEFTHGVMPALRRVSGTRIGCTAGRSGLFHARQPTGADRQMVASQVLTTRYFGLRRILPATLTSCAIAGGAEPGVTRARNCHPGAAVGGTSTSPVGNGAWRKIGWVCPWAHVRTGVWSNGVASAASSDPG